MLKYVRIKALRENKIVIINTFVTVLFIIVTLTDTHHHQQQQQQYTQSFVTSFPCNIINVQNTKHLGHFEHMDSFSQQGITFPGKLRLLWEVTSCESQPGQHENA